VLTQKQNDELPLVGSSDIRLVFALALGLLESAAVSANRLAIDSRLALLRWHPEIRSALPLNRSTCSRDYNIIRTSDGARVTRGRALWVYIDSKSGRPLRLPEEIKVALSPTWETEELGIRGYKSRLVNDSYRYHSRRWVQTYELDPLALVRHTVFFNWIEQAYYNAIRLAGHPLEQLRSGDWMVFQGGHEIEYFRPARDNDEIEIISWICEVGRVRGAWIHEIYEAGTRTLLARDYSLGIFVNHNGKPTVAPQSFIADILHGVP